MATYSGRIEFCSPIHQRQRQIYLAKPVSLAALQTFALFLGAEITTVDITTIGFSEIVPVFTVGEGGEMSSVLTDLHIRCRNTDTKKSAVLHVPAPKLALFEPIAKQGYRLKEAAGETFAKEFGKVKGCTLEFEEGWLIGETGS